MKSELSRRGFRQRMRNFRSFELSEQNLAGQTRIIKTNSWLSELELEEISRESWDNNFLKMEKNLVILIKNKSQHGTSTIATYKNTWKALSTNKSY